MDRNKMRNQKGITIIVASIAIIKPITQIEWIILSIKAKKIIFICLYHHAALKKSASKPSTAFMSSKKAFHLGSSSISLPLGS